MRRNHFASSPERQTVAHRERPRADEAFPSGAQQQPLDRTPGGVGSVEHPDRLAPLRSRFENVTQRRHEGVDPATHVLQVDEQHVEGVHHGRCRPPHIAVQAEDRDPVHGVGEVRRLDHVVLLVAAQSVLGPEGGRKLDVFEGS